MQKISLNKRKKQDLGVASELKKKINLKKKIFIRDEISKPETNTFHSQMIRRIRIFPILFGNLYHHPEEHGLHQTKGVFRWRISRQVVILFLH